jgi:uncharacterized membrane protein
MAAIGPFLGLAAIVACLLLAQRLPAAARLFRWAPVPLWCYLLPALAVEIGWLPEPSRHPAYRGYTNLLLPPALGLLLIGTDLRALLRAGRPALAAAAAGAAGIILGAPLGISLLQSRLPPEAWKGAGALAGTWTGGTMNLLSLRTVLNTPEEVFAPLVVVDALIAYGWMALLVAGSACQRPVNRWLGAQEEAARLAEATEAAPARAGGWPLAACAGLVAAVALVSWQLAQRLPTSGLVSSAAGWMVLLVTAGSLGCSLLPAARSAGAAGGAAGYPLLYLVLASSGAQADVRALWSTPAWVLLGLVMAAAHAGALLLAGRLGRIPLGVLATASQANIGGVVSSPLVGAVYSRRLAPVGLLLAVAGNALGTGLGLAAAALCRLATG